MKQLNVQAIFNSIDGEVNGFGGAGELTTFIRLKQCNLKCVECFGVIPGRRLPKITLSSGSNKRLHEVTVGDLLLTYDENMDLVETKVAEIHTREVDSWYRVKINGILYTITEEHPFFTTRGLIKMKDLKVGDEILHSTYQEKLSFMMTGKKNPVFKEGVIEKRTLNTDYTLLGKKISSTIKEKQENGTYHSTWSVLSEDRKKELRKIISDGKKGSKNPNWKGGTNRPNYLILSSMCAEKELITCSICDKEAKLEVHHLDGNPLNDSFDNLSSICHQCHSKIHKRGNNFWISERTDGKNVSAALDFQLFMMNGFKVEKITFVDRTTYAPSIRPKPLKVYNLSCFPYNTYLIDNMWVHNCDTAYSQSAEPYNWMTLDQIVNYPNMLDKITLTGGEPLLQENTGALISLLLELGHTVSVETNGSVSIPKLIPTEPLQSDKLQRLEEKNLRYIVDYKLSSTTMGQFMNLDIFSSLRKVDIIKFVISDVVDYNEALELIDEHEKEWKAQIVFSPGFSCDHSDTSWATELADKIVKNASDFPYIQYSLQIHKILWPGAVQER